MKRKLQILNFAGVLALCVLAVFQWRADGALHERVHSLETIQHRQERELAKKDETIQGCKEDLDDFRMRLEQTEKELSETRTKLAAARAERDRLTAERDSLKVEVKDLRRSLAQWKAAVAVRDRAIEHLNSQGRKLVGELNDAVERFNTLAARFGKVQDELVRAGRTVNALLEARNEAVEKYNGLAKKYNRLVESVRERSSIR